MHISCGEFEYILIKMWKIKHNFYHLTFIIYFNDQFIHNILNDWNKKKLWHNDLM